MEFDIYPRLKDKIVLITGASAGIGRACAYQFAACGSKLILTARRIDILEEIKTEITEKYSVEVFVHQLDLSYFESCDNFYKSIPESLKNVDILVNNAGLALGLDKTWENKWDRINKMIDVNVKGLLKMIMLFVPDMIKRDSGHIINVGSIAGKQVYSGGSVYCGTKHMVDAINSTLRLELVDTSIRVTHILPGAVKTEFSMVRYEGDKEKAEKVYENFQPLIAEDVSDAIVYTASRRSHVQISELTLFSSSQADVRTFHRTVPKGS